MSKGQKQPNRSESFTEDGVNFWRNPKSPRGSYLAQYRLSNGTKKCIGCGTNESGKAYSYAIKKRDLQEAEIAGTDGKKIISIDDLCIAFLADRKALGGSSDTLKMFVSMTNRIRGFRLCHLTKQPLYVERNGREVPTLIHGGVFAHQLTQAMYDEYVKAMMKSLADGTLRTLLSRLATMYQWAKQEGYATSKIDFKKFNKQIHTSPIRSRRFKEEELDKILHWLKHESKKSRHNYYRLLCCSELGLRIGEVCSIRVVHVDTTEKAIQVARLKKKQRILEELRMTGHLTSELEEYIVSLPSGQVYLFQGKDGSPMKAGSEWFRRACAKCGLDDENLEDLVIHSARSKFIMDQLDDGRPLPKIMGSVGHNAVTTTMRYLRVTRKESQVEAVEASNQRRVQRNARIAELEAELAKVKKKMDAHIKKMKDL